MDLIRLTNEKIHESRKELISLMNKYLRDEISEGEFWAEHKLLDERTTVINDNLQRINPFLLFKYTSPDSPANQLSGELKKSVLRLVKS